MIPPLTSGSATGPMGLLRFTRADQASLIISLLLLLSITAMIFWPVIDAECRITTGSDFDEHHQLVSDWLADKPAVATHPFYHWVVYFTALLTGLQVADAGALSTLLFYESVVTILMVRFWLSMRPDPTVDIALSQRSSAMLWSGIGVLAVMVANPITIATWVPPNFYFGYANVNVYHNPTIVALRPMSLIAFYLAAVLVIHDPARRDWVWKYAISLVIAICCSALAKPNFVMCFLPAILTWCVVSMIASRLTPSFPGHWKRGLGVLFLAGAPAVLTLIFQLTRYDSGDHGNSFAFRPFALGEDSFGLAVLKFLLSLAFPLAVTGLFWNRARKDFCLMLAWLTFAWGFFIATMFIETGSRKWHGNFGWCAQIATFLLFVESMAFFLRHGWTTPVGSSERESLWRKACFVLVLLAAHVTCGIGFLILHIKMPEHVERFYY